MSDVIKVVVSVSTGMVGSTNKDEFKIERSVWESMSEEDRESLCRDTMFNMIDWNYQVEGVED